MWNSDECKDYKIVLKLTPDLSAIIKFERSDIYVFHTRFSNLMVRLPISRQERTYFTLIFNFSCKITYIKVDCWSIINMGSCSRWTTCYMLLNNNLQETQYQENSPLYYIHRKIFSCVILKRLQNITSYKYNSSNHKNIFVLEW